MADGFHRVMAARKAGHADIPVDLALGTKRDAIFYACGSNKHGKARTNDDKRRAEADDSPPDDIADLIAALEVRSRYEGLTDEQEWTLARQLNEANQDFTPVTFVQDAEFIWGWLAEGYTQDQVAQRMAWSRDKVKNYAALAKFCAEAWVLIGTTFSPAVPGGGRRDVPEDGTIVPNPFTEGLLREAIYLTDAQQVKVLRAYLKHRDKGKFKTQCTYDRAENELVAEAERQLKGLPEDYLAQAVAEIRKGLDALGELAVALDGVTRDAVLLG